jgi:hypothetical protein
MNFKDFFKEAIALSTAKKKYTSKQSPNYQNTSKKISEIFKGKHRLVYPINISQMDESKNHLLFKEIQKFLAEKGVHLDNFSDYVKGIGYKIKNGKPDIKNPMKFGGILEREAPMGEIEVTKRTLDPVTGLYSKEKTTVPGRPLAHEFKMDPTRKPEGERFVVISRHPYDIAGMSTDRSWRSCMDLGPSIEYKSPKREEKRGQHADYVEQDIAAGALIAYLVSDADRDASGNLAIRRPLGRILMKPYISKDGHSPVYSMGPVYGAGAREFSAFINDWLIKFNGDLQGEYELTPGLYMDYEELPGRKDLKRFALKYIYDNLTEDELNTISLNKNLPFENAANEILYLKGTFLVSDKEAEKKLRSNSSSVLMHQKYNEYNKKLSDKSFISNITKLGNIVNKFETILKANVDVEYYKENTFALRFNIPLDFRDISKHAEITYKDIADQLMPMMKKLKDIIN